MNALAQEKGIKKAHICRKLGKPVYYLRDVERNRSDIQGESLQIIADILGTTPEYLSGETDEKSPPAPKSESGRSETMAQIIETAERLQPVQREFLLAFLRTVVQNTPTETPQGQRSWTISHAATAAREIPANANIHP